MILLPLKTKFASVPATRTTGTGLKLVKERKVYDAEYAKLHAVAESLKSESAVVEECFMYPVYPNANAYSPATKGLGIPRAL